MSAASSDSVRRTIFRFFFFLSVVSTFFSLNFFFHLEVYIWNYVGIPKQRTLLVKEECFSQFSSIQSYYKDFLKVIYLLYSIISLVVRVLTQANLSCTLRWIVHVYRSKSCRRGERRTVRSEP